MSGIKESYIANWKNLPNIAYKVRVARPSILSPSKELLEDYKQKKIDWDEYEKRFRKEILNNPKAMNELSILKTISKVKDVYLICYEKNYPCHRFILMDIIKEDHGTCYDCGRLLTKGNTSASRFSGHPLCRKCAKFP